MLDFIDNGLGSTISGATSAISNDGTIDTVSNSGTISSSFFMTKQASGRMANWLKTSNID